MALAPIVLFVYNRLTNTQTLLNSLLRNSLAKDSILYVYSDGAKEDATDEQRDKITTVREFVKSKNWCKEVHLIEAEKNLGCGPSIIKGVTEVINKHGKMIVIEDDLNLSPFFLNYINDALDLYEDEPKVSSIGSCNFFACGDKFPSTFFIQYPDCLGWATWANRWSSFEPDADKLLKELREKNLIEKFNGHGAFKMEELLIAQANNQVSAWDVQWTATCILNDWFTLYPNPAVTQHLFIENATHASFNVVPPLLEEKIVLEKVEVIVIPEVYAAMKLGYQGKGDFYGNKIKIKKDQTFYLNKLRSYYHRTKKFARSIIK
ncbi:glycosyltransferase family 2 protein [Pedobacter sp. LMG 31464]|uniref:Glycosyltransferase family 2 protein n=1 Tax=Pedobacter planticolens TaxID=2679964 RepID=A0A923DUI2_9SPHI|nr:glycosyltransferase family 2 protein [Pedobacter planticolens]MBB2144111.1 glycosyltransferase family 2 protein [Pedobacter planticolens]